MISTGRFAAPLARFVRLLATGVTAVLPGSGPHADQVARSARPRTDHAGRADAEEPEELAALRAASSPDVATGTRAGRASRTASAYLDTRRRRLRQELEDV